MHEETTTTNEIDAGPAPPEPVLGHTSLLAQYYSLLFGTSDWGETSEPTLYPSGPVPASAGGLARRRLKDPEARFHLAAMMAEVMLLPMCVAHDAAEKAALIAEIGQVVGLAEAVQRQWIEGYTICWRSGRFPTSPTGIRVRTAPGRRTRAQVLGSLESHIRRFIARAKVPSTDTIHILGDRRIG